MTIKVNYKSRYSDEERLEHRVMVLKVSHILLIYTIVRVSHPCVKGGRESVG